VGVITQFGLVAEHGLRLLVVIVVSTWVGRPSRRWCCGV
jgi:putative effector of murein hydrolase LrgA (UPF0299 family)